MAALAVRLPDFLAAGARLYAVSVDLPRANSAVMEALALPFPILSDPDRNRAITPLGFADEKDPRLISKPGVVVIAPDGNEVWRHKGRDYADRPHEDQILAEVSKLGLTPTSQVPPILGEPVSGPHAMPVGGLRFYLRGAKFAALALRSRHRSISEAFKDDAKEFVARCDRYLEALSAVEERTA